MPQGIELFPGIYQVVKTLWGVSTACEFTNLSSQSLHLPFSPPHPDTENPKCHVAILLLIKESERGSMLHVSFIDISGTDNLHKCKLIKL